MPSRVVEVVPRQKGGAHLGLFRVESELRRRAMPFFKKVQYSLQVNGKPFGDGGRLNEELLQRVDLPSPAGAEIVFVHPFAEYLTNPAAYVDLVVGCWIFPFYYLLKDEGYPVALSTDLVEGCINVAPITLFPHFSGTPQTGERALRRCKVVVACAELSPTVPDVDGVFFLKQNPTTLRARGDMAFYLFERNLRERALDRTERLRTAAFLGCETNLHPTLKMRRFHERLRRLGVEFRIVGATHADRWSDYEDIDLILAVRPELNDPHTAKPASKLVNAWRAGVPMIAGRESAYEALGTDGVDVFFASTVDDVVSHIERLTDPERYARARAAVRVRQAEFSNSRIAESFYTGLVTTVGAP